MRKSRFHLVMVFVLASMTQSGYAQENYFTKLQADRNLSYRQICQRADSFYQVNDSLAHTKGSGYKDLLRWHYNYQGRVDINGSLDAYLNAYSLELQKRNKPAANTNSLKQGSFSSSSQSWCQNNFQASWKSLGYETRPASLFGTSYPINSNGMGWTHCVYVDPGDPDFVLAGSNNGGLWKSTNFTSANPTWTNITGDQIGGMGVNSIAVDPGNRDIIYISPSFGDGYLGALGIWKTTNGGASWTRVMMQNMCFSKIVLNPYNSNEVFAIMHDRIFRSFNGGADGFADEAYGHRTQFNPDIEDYVNYGWTDLEILPLGSNQIKIFVTGSIHLVSTDGGDTYQAISYQQSGSHSEGRIAISGQFPNVVYRTYLANGLPVIEKSIDYGTTWNIRWNGTFNSGGWYLGKRKNCMEISTVDPDRLYYGGTRFYIYNDVTGTMSQKDNIHDDMRGAMVFNHSAFAETLVMGCDGGIFSATYNTGSPAVFTWVDKNGTGLQVQQLYKMDLFEENGTPVIYTGNHDQSTLVRTGPVEENAGTWTHLDHTGGDGGTVLHDPDNTDLFLCSANPYALVKSRTQQFLSKLIAYKGMYYNDMVYHTNTKNLFIPDSFKIGNITYYDLIRVYDPFNTSASSETRLSNLSLPSPILSLAVSDDEQTIYFALEGPGTDRFWKSIDGGATWANISSSIPALASAGINDIVMDPTNPSQVWLSMGFVSPTSTQKVYQYNGTSWTDISAGIGSLPVNVLALDHTNGIDLLYAGTDMGVFYRNNLTGQWLPFWNDLPACRISDLVLDKEGHKLIAATFGRGLWYTDLPCCDMAGEVVISTGSTVAWSNERTVYQDVVIQSGAELTITGKVYMQYGKRFKVEPGGVLKLNGAHITSNCQGLWYGIQVLGTSSLPQNSPGAQGKVNIQHSLIENAYRAVEAGDENILSAGGGIVQVYNSEFRNCRVAIGFRPYPAFNNGSYIYNSIFECSRKLWDPNNIGTLHFISLHAVAGVEIAACTFRNTAPAGAFNDDNRATGVVIIDASCRIDLDQLGGIAYDPLQDCTYPVGQRNLFQGLSAGVTVMDIDPSIPENVWILKSDFINVQKGIVLAGEDQKIVHDNTFIWDQDLIVDDPLLLGTPNNAIAGIFCPDAKKLFLDKNTMEFNGTFNYPQAIGVYVSNTFTSASDLSHIYQLSVLRNSAGFTPVIRGVYIEGHNPSLMIRCNLYHNLSFDWYITTMSPNIMNVQGNNLEGTNQFSSCTGSGPVRNIYTKVPFFLYPAPPQTFTPYCINAGGPMPIIGTASGTDPCTNTSPCIVRTAYRYPGQQGSGGGEGLLIDQDSSALSVKEAVPEKGYMNIVPNPASTQCKVSYRLPSAPVNAGLRVFNSLGQQFMFQLLNNGQDEVVLNTSGWTPGVYLLILENNGTRLDNQRVVIVR